MHHNETKTPLIRLAKRDMMAPWKAWCIRVGSILVALLLGGRVQAVWGRLDPEPLARYLDALGE